MTERQPVKKFSPEVRQRAVRMVLEHRGEHTSEWATIGSIAGKIGCTAETPRSWVRPARHREHRPETPASGAPTKGFGPAVAYLWPHTVRSCGRLSSE